ncbi:MAG TPA: hypothetical protein VFG79_22995 [Solirubrobacter sp.]|nr:hypothetical protein [Solirubrobacter sp.]
MAQKRAARRLAACEVVDRRASVDVVPEVEDDGAGAPHQRAAEQRGVLAQPRLGGVDRAAHVAGDGRAGPRRKVQDVRHGATIDPGVWSRVKGHEDR